MIHISYRQSVLNTQQLDHRVVPRIAGGLEKSVWTLVFSKVWAHVHFSVADFAGSRNLNDIERVKRLEKVRYAEADTSTAFVEWIRRVVFLGIQAPAFRKTF